MRNQNRPQRKPQNSALRRKLNQTTLLTTKIQPWQVKRNRQLVSIPAHRENGFSMERVFRFNLPGTQSLVNMKQVWELIQSELGLNFNSLNPVTITIKDLTIYSLRSFTGRVYYTSLDPSANSVNMSQFSTYSDYVNSAGVASVSVIYPLDARPSVVHLDSAANSRVLCTISQLSAPDIWVVDIRCYVTVNNSGQPTMSKVLSLPPSEDDSEVRQDFP